MIDGVRLGSIVEDYNAWKQAVNISFSTTVSDTGEIKSKVRNIKGTQQTTIVYRSTFETYSIQAKEVERKRINKDSLTDHYLTIDGSLHKNYFKGQNYSQFDWDKLQEEITKIETGLSIDATRLQIFNIEIGVNIRLPFEVFPFLKRCLISHKGKPFNLYRPDRSGFVLGYYCDHSQYSVKIYDKGKQYNLPDPLMRFELRFTKMQPLKEYGIKLLSDLRDHEKVNSLFVLLQAGWENVLLFDQSINLKRSDLRPKERELLKEGSNPKYWEHLKETNVRQFNSKREQFKQLVKKYGQNLHETIREEIKREWETLSKNCTNLPSGKTSDLYKFTLKVKGKNVHTQPVQRCCVSCGRDITHQRADSIFCSSKYVGEDAAHKCRNTDSNQRNNLRGKVKRITAKGVLFDITPYLSIKAANFPTR